MKTLLTCRFIRSRAAIALVSIGLSIVAGCAGSERTIVSVEYVLSPSKGLPAGLRTVAIAPAECGPATDARWSDITTNLLHDLIHRSKERFGLDLRITSRDEARKVWEEADLTAAGLTTAGAGGAPARLLNVDAFIVSEINIREKVDRGSETTISGIDVGALFGDDYGGGRGAIQTREVEKVKKSVYVQAMFKLVDAKTGETWATHQKKTSKTEQTKASPLFGSGEGEAGLTPTDDIARPLIERAAREFLSKLMPCEIVTEMEVSSSGNPACVDGVMLLRADLHEDALDQFRQAIANHPDDHQAFFGAGAACEAMGEYKGALKYYRRALAARNVARYAAAKRRLSRDIDHIRKDR